MLADRLWSTHNDNNHGTGTVSYTINYLVSPKEDRTHDPGLQFVHGDTHDM